MMSFPRLPERADGGGGSAVGGCTLSPPPPLRTRPTCQGASVRCVRRDAGVVEELELLRLGRLVRVTDSTRRGPESIAHVHIALPRPLSCSID